MLRPFLAPWNSGTAGRACSYAPHRVATGLPEWRLCWTRDAAPAANRQSPGVGDLTQAHALGEAEQVLGKIALDVGQGEDSARHNTGFVTEDRSRALAKIKVLSVGLIPTLIDFSEPAYAAYPGMSAEKVQAGLDKDEALLNELGYDSELCLVDFGETAETVLRERLQQKTYDCIMVGAGVRLIAPNTFLFEKLLNIAHAHAPKAKLCFNTGPTDSAAAIQRWFPQP